VCFCVCVGEKFKHNGIFFKYAIDTNALYGGDAFAMKVAEHELKGLTAYASCGMILGLNFGLMCLIDYRGFRLIAVSELPIEPSSLIYGSADGGCTIHADVDEMNELMEHCARLLNLKGHYAGLSGSKTLMHGPADCEGHLGRDGRFYLIDLARVYPPETPDKSRPGSFLYRLLRPELVSRFHTPLSSDAFTAFGRDDHHEHDREVRDATAWLREEVVPEFADWLAGHFVFLRCAAQPTTRDILVLLAELHRAGINIRYLDMVRQRLQSAALRRLIITEVCARTLKNLARARMRALQTSDDRAFTLLLVDFFNGMLATDGGARRRWRAEVEPLLCSEFGLQQSESVRAFDEVHRPLLYARLQELVGVRFLPAWPSDHCSPLPLRLEHLAEVYVREKRMYAILRVEADSALARARQVQGGDRADYLRLAMDKYRAVLHLKPSDYVCLSNLGQVMVDLAAHHAGEERDRLLRVAFQKFESSLRIHPDDYRTLTAWARGLLQCARGLLETAEPGQALRRLRGLTATSPSIVTVDQGPCARALALFTQAHQLYEHAYQLQPQDYETLTSWGDTLLAHANLEMDLGRSAFSAAKKLQFALKVGSSLSLWDFSLSSLVDSIVLWPHARAHAHTHTHTYIHIYKHTHTHACTHIHIHTRIHTHATFLFCSVSLSVHLRFVLAVVVSFCFVLFFKLFSQSVLSQPNDDPLEMAHLRRGSCFLLLCRAEASSQRELLMHAEREFREANRIRHACARYHLAKLACLANNVRECVQHLRLAAESGLLPSSIGTALADLHPLSIRPGFAAMLERLVQVSGNARRSGPRSQSSPRT
jgi:tetratricopeptide (TPR) repeat protein